MMKFASQIAVVLCSLLLLACATPAASIGETEIRSGVIEQIMPAEIQSSHHKGLGAIVGGLGGAALGSLAGGGTGKDLMMVAGAIGGAMAGNAEQEKYDQPKPGQQVIVRLNNGVLVSVTQLINPNLRQGMHVYVQGSGTDTTVIAQ